MHAHVNHNRQRDRWCYRPPEPHPRPGLCLSLEVATHKRTKFGSQTTGAWAHQCPLRPFCVLKDTPIQTFTISIYFTIPLGQPLKIILLLIYDLINPWFDSINRLGLVFQNTWLYCILVITCHSNQAFLRGLELGSDLVSPQFYHKNDLTWVKSSYTWSFLYLLLCITLSFLTLCVCVCVCLCLCLCLCLCVESGGGERDIQLGERGKCE